MTKLHNRTATTSHRRAVSRSVTQGIITKKFIHTPSAADWLIMTSKVYDVFLLVLSSEPEISSTLSGLKATEYTGPECPRMTLTDSAVVGSIASSKDS